MAAVIKTLAVLGGTTFVGYTLMKTTSPDKEKMMKMLPADMITDEKLKLVEEQNERLFTALKNNMNSKDPIWKVKEHPK